MSCADLYHSIADHYKEDRSSLLLWKKAAMEEENHAKQFALIARLRRQNIIEPIRVDPVDAEVALIYVESLVDRVKAQPPARKEALLMAIRLEEKLSLFHIENVVKFVDPSYEQSFTAITQADKKHFEALREAYERLQ